MWGKRMQLLLLLGIVVPLLAQDTPSIVSFSVMQTSASVRVTLTLSRSVTATSGCFMDKIVFYSDASMTTGSTTRYMPSRPGTCEFGSSASSFLTGTMDIEDYTNALSFVLLTSASNSFIATEGSSPVSLVPGVVVNPISSPLPVTTFVSLTTQPSLVSFDFDMNSDQLLLHFSALMDTNTMNIPQLMLSAGPDTESSPLSLASSLSSSVRYATTVCISVSAGDRTVLQQRGICTDTSNCFCHFSSGLISDHVGNTVVGIGPAGPLQVSIYRREGQPTTPLFMRLSLSYIGCTAVHDLAEDEVYILRPFESVTSINCSSTDEQVNSRPQISRVASTNVSISDYVSYDWPLTAYLNFSRGVPSQLIGQYVCRSDEGNIIRNFLNDDASIVLLGGTTYSLPLKDPLTIALYYASTDLTQTNVEISLQDSSTGSEIGIDPTIRRWNPFHVDIEYLMAESALGGSYVIRIVRQGTTLAMQPITIAVTEPTLTLLPEVATILPNQLNIELSCTTNSDVLQVTWFGGTSRTPLSSRSSLMVTVPPAARNYRCEVTDPVTSSLAAEGIVIVRDVQEHLSLWQDGVQVANNSLVEVVNSRSPDLELQCVEHVDSVFTNLTWLVLPNNGSLVAPVSGEDSETYRVTKSGNQANLTIENSDPFRGLLKCLSSSGREISVRVVQNAEDSFQVCDEEVDSVWQVHWNATPRGHYDFQPCPRSDLVSGVESSGLALRLCGEDGVWNDTIDISDCSSENFINLQTMAERDIFNLRNAYSQTELNSHLAGLTSQLVTMTQPKATTYFPRDLDVVNNILRSFVEVLSDRNVALDNTDIVMVFNNLLRESNIEGWVLLSEINNGSQMLLSTIEAFGISMLESLQVSNSRSGSVSADNIDVSAMLISSPYNQSVVYPADVSEGAQVTIPASILQQVNATGVVHVIMTNMDDILPKPDSALVVDSNQLMVASTVMSTQIMTASGILMSQQQFSGDAVVSLELTTDMVPRAQNPVCVFWNADEGEWSREGVETVPPISVLQDGEVKQYRVSCSASHLTAFGIAVDFNTAEFDFSIPVYVGCGFVIFSALLSIFSLLLSWLCDGLRRYSVVAFLVHMSFITSLLCAYIAFLAGIEQAVNNRIGCAAVAGLLHYFFTAAFTWLLCEGLLLVFFKSFSKYYGLFLVMFLIGWGLPAIPTAISVGILHESYGTTTQCWFFFDGVISNSVVLGFIVPKLFLIAVTLFLLIVSCCTTCKFGNKRMQPFIRASVTRVLWLIWASICIFLFFLSAVWVFALLLVNVYGIDSVILGWVFMIASIILSLWVFIFSAVTMVINQKVDYERIWDSSTIDSVYPSSDPGRGKGYQFMNTSALDLTGRRTSTLTRHPQGLSNPVFEPRK